MTFKLAQSFTGGNGNGLAATIDAIRSATAAIAAMSRATSRPEPSLAQPFGFKAAHATDHQACSPGGDAATASVADFARNLQTAILRGSDPQFAKDVRDALVDMNQNGVKIKNLPDTTARWS